MDDQRLAQMLRRIVANEELRDLLRTNPQALAERLELDEAEYTALQAANPFIGISGPPFDGGTHTITGHTMTFTITGGTEHPVVERGTLNSMVRNLGVDFDKDDWVTLVVRMATDPAYLARIRRFLNVGETGETGVET